MMADHKKGIVNLYDGLWFILLVSYEFTRTLYTGTTSSLTEECLLVTGERKDNV